MLHSVFGLLTVSVIGVVNVPKGFWQRNKAKPIRNAKSEEYVHSKCRSWAGGMRVTAKSRWQ